VISTRWLRQREVYWTALEDLVDRVASHGFGALSRIELQEIGRLYRQMAADLATLREDPGSAQVAASLNHLLARAHHTIYSAERPTRSATVRYFRETFPAAFRRNRVHCLIALALFVIGAAVGIGVTYRDPDLTARLIGPKMVETIERHEMWTHSIVSVKPFASSQIMTNNLSVSFMAFAAGITGGVGTCYMLLFNGLLIGVIATACGLAGMSLQLWSFVAPHGVLELPAIFIAGGGGLRLAQGLLFPGFLPRRRALALAGTEALNLILGVVPMLVVAGLIEAFVSPTDLAIPLKFALGGALFTLLCGYLLMTGRGRTVLKHEVHEEHEL
jgi:uncharacterized membrane protein SpoIIM required for sporulation